MKKCRSCLTAAAACGGWGEDWRRAGSRASRFDRRTGAGGGPDGYMRHRDRGADSGGRHGDGRRLLGSQWLPGRSTNRFLRLFVLANTPLHVSHARWGRRVASSNPCCERRCFGLLLDLDRQSVTGHSSTNQRPRRGEIFDWTTGEFRVSPVCNQSAKRQISILRNLTYRCKKWDRRSARAHSLRRSPCRRRPLCVHSSTRENFFVSMSAMSASFTVAPVRHAQAIRRSRKATGKVSVRRGVVAKAVEAAPKLVTTKSEEVSFTISRARYLPRTPGISPRSYQPRDGGRGGARRGNPVPPDDSSRQNAPRHWGNQQP